MSSVSIKRARKLKRKIIPSMGSIYATAGLVVVAAAGEDAEGGLPGTENNPRPQEEVLLRFATAAGDDISLVKFEPPREKIRNCRWFTRAWTFQEFIFAKRALFVMPDEVFLFCDEGIQEEMFSVSKKPHSVHWLHSEVPLQRARKTLLQSVPHTWALYRNTVEEYSRLELTYEKDRLAALAGYLSQINRSIPNEELVLRTGILADHFGPGLIWTVENEYQGRRRFPYSHASRPRDCDAPSWSWASAGRPVRFARYYNIDGLYKATGFTNSIIGNLQAVGKKLGPKATVTATDSPMQSVVLSHERNPTIHLVTMIFHARIAPVRGNKYRHIREYWFAPPDGSLEVDLDDLAYSSNGFLVDEDRHGKLDPKTPSIFAVAMPTTLDDFPQTDFAVMLLHRVKDGYERVSLGFLRNDTLNDLIEDDAHAGWAYIKLR